MKRLLPALAFLVALAPTPAALASVTVTTNAQRPSLRVDSRSYAEVGWTARAVRKTLLIPPRGEAYPGGRLPGRDVSRAARDVRSELYDLEKLPTSVGIGEAAVTLLPSRACRPCRAHAAPSAGAEC